MLCELRTVPSYVTGPGKLGGDRVCAGADGKAGLSEVEWSGKGIPGGRNSICKDGNEQSL